MNGLPNRPYPPAALFEQDLEGAFARAREVEEWIRRHFIEPDGVFFDDIHESLQQAYVGVLWATKEIKVRGLVPAGTAEMPTRSVARMSGHAKEMWLWQLRRFFGDEERPGRIPDYLLTFDAKYAAESEDVEWCATVKHELCHCGQETWDGKRDGPPRFTKTGRRVWTMWPHGVETFPEVAEAFGPVERGVPELMAALSRRPKFGAAQIEVACGYCMARAA